jgi:hypothetical protein
MIYYAGIGSRETPSEFCNLFERVAFYLAQKGCVLRSGHAKGADQAFEYGCDKARGQKEIYLPWKGFELSNSDLIVEINKEAYKIAKEFHPYFYRMSIGGQKLQARNSHQVLGKDLKTPSNFIICWTKGGKGEGGTGQALRIAKHYEIPIFDAGSYMSEHQARLALNEFIKTFVT